MEFFKEVLSYALGKNDLQVSFSDLSLDFSAIFEKECFEILQEIKTIIEDDTLSDFECIEEIVCILEGIGSNGGNRHDFG